MPRTTHYLNWLNQHREFDSEVLADLLEHELFTLGVPYHRGHYTTVRCCDHDLVVPNRCPDCGADYNGYGQLMKIGA